MQGKSALFLLFFPLLPVMQMHTWKKNIYSL